VLDSVGHQVMQEDPTSLAGIIRELTGPSA
jgi:hypothetical protein